MEGLYRTDLHTVSILASITMCCDNISHGEPSTEEKLNWVLLNKIKPSILNIICSESKLKLANAFVSYIRRFIYAIVLLLRTTTHLILSVSLVIRAFIG